MGDRNRRGFLAKAQECLELYKKTGGLDYLATAKTLISVFLELMELEDELKKMDID